MISLIEALNYRCLRYIRQRLRDFQVLVGPNASGKTTFLDVVAFLGELVDYGLDETVYTRTKDFSDLVWNREKKPLELAIELKIPVEKRTELKGDYNTVRYEVKIGYIDSTSEIGILFERAHFKKTFEERKFARDLFPKDSISPSSITTKKVGRKILGKNPQGNDNYYLEVSPETGKGYFPSIKLGPKKSTLANLPDDVKKFPVATWLKSFLIQGVQRIELNCSELRLASPPYRGKYGFLPDGSNLPWVIKHLKEENPEKFKSWIEHLQTALPDLNDIFTITRDDDKYCYLKIKYKNGLEIPSWVTSDGTLRFLALTILAYIPNLSGIYLIEEPENGIHPNAVEALYQSLSSVYDAQILLATHSPVILSMAKVEDILCFKKTELGATDIVWGSEHPRLRDWRGDPNLSVIFASGVL
jgi:predicted ATPase